MVLFSSKPMFAFLQFPTRALTGSMLPIACLILSTSTPLHANTYQHKSADGTVTFSDAPVSNGVVQRTSYKTKSGRASNSTAPSSNPCQGLSVAQIDAKGAQLHPLFNLAATENGVDGNLLISVARAESCFNHKAESRAGAQGLMQLMPNTCLLYTSPSPRDRG